MGVTYRRMNASLPYRDGCSPTGVPYCGDPDLTCSFGQAPFEASRIPRPQDCPVKVPSTLHAAASHNPRVSRPEVMRSII